MASLLLPMDRLLRAGTGAESALRRLPSVSQALTIAVVCGCTYGAVMGSFSGFANGHALQILYSSIKVPALLGASFLLALPSYFVLNTLAGLRGDMREAFRALMVSQASLTVVLIALAPYTLLWYACSGVYRSAILFNSLIFALAALAAQVVLRGCYAPLIKRNPMHLWMLRLWIVLYGFVGIQMGWLLRPFIGTPWDAPSFLRPDAWDNAYVIVARMIFDQLTHQGR